MSLPCCRRGRRHKLPPSKCCQTLGKESPELAGAITSVLLNSEALEVLDTSSDQLAPLVLGQQRGVGGGRPALNNLLTWGRRVVELKAVGEHLQHSQSARIGFAPRRCRSLMLLSS